MDHNVIVSDYSAMDRVLKEERTYILNIVKQIKKAGCNVLLVQKSILRDAVSDLAIHFLDKIKVMVVKDIEREDIEFVCKVSIYRCSSLFWVGGEIIKYTHFLGKPRGVQDSNHPEEVANIPTAGGSDSFSVVGERRQWRHENLAIFQNRYWEPRTNFGGTSTGTKTF